MIDNMLMAHLKIEDMRRTGMFGSDGVTPVQAEPPGWRAYLVGRVRCTLNNQRGSLNEAIHHRLKLWVRTRQA